MNKKLKIILILIVLLIFSFFLFKGIDFQKGENVQLGGPTTINLCYLKTDVQEKGSLVDQYDMKLSITVDKIEGELNFLPSEKDAKTGTFQGEVFEVDEFSGERKADLIWEAYSEGVEQKEELRIVFSEDVASIGFGIMTQSKNGIWVYKNPQSIAYLLTLENVPCQ